ncbi:hypothetical protein GCM10011571_09800 [Marinithermofilum abyssi]|uniref:DUF2627 domain-containing protein n=1 Tax=Marinithermofilum abyssi TaxID=1571185 RepID=A0A8J2VGM1_9BACL|nr:DUF2627 family protein [Marinithermofilum abyssi]GGE10529.1 hypothetical protein GCM10011571_09800 [Marinithermofilum abyssi]
MIYQRIFALAILCIPGAASIYGWTWMRDIFFASFAGQPFDWLAFAGALTLFLGGLFFLAGFLFYRDDKNNLIQPMLRRKKKPASQEPQSKN